MKITKCMFSKTFPVAGIYYEKVFLEAELNEGDDVRKSLYELKRQVEDFHYESTKAAEKQAVTKVIDATPLDRTASIIRDIGTVKDLKVLETYTMIAKTKPEIQAAYNRQYEIISVLENSKI